MIAALCMHVVCLALGLPEVSDGIPLALRMAEQYRRDLGSVDILWKSIQFVEPGSFSSRVFTPDKADTVIQRYRTRSAWNADFSSERLGDPNGVLQYDEQSNTPEVMTSFGLLVRRNGEVWNYTRGLASAQLWKDKDVEAWRRANLTLSDIRIVGLNANFQRFKILGVDALLPLASDLKGFEEELIEGGLRRVCMVDGTGARLCWYINPDKGWNPERVVVQNADGAEAMRMEADVRQFNDGVWFPQSVAIYVNGNLAHSIEIERAVFNDPNLKQLAPDSIGIEPGVRVNPQARSLPRGTYVWDGDRISTSEEWFAAVKEGKKSPGPSVRFAHEHGTDHLIRQKPAPVGDLSEWERFVLVFIARYKLNKDQMEQAWKVHADCKERADKYLRSQEEAIRKLQKELATQPQDAQLLKRRAEIKKPINEIFEKQLRPRLDRLPTRSQREQAQQEAEQAGRKDP